MVFAKKLRAEEAAGTLVPVGTGAFAPYAILWCPVYLALPRNGKFLVLKAPLDFFTPEELARIPGGLHIPAAKAFAPSIRLAETVKKALKEEALPPYVIGRNIFSDLKKLQGENGALDPFRIAVFSGTLCAPLDPALLLAARDRDVEDFESALLRAGLAVFIALSLEYLDVRFLHALFQRAVSLSMRLDGQDERSGTIEEEEILSLAFDAVQGNLERGTGRVARKLFSVLEGGRVG